MRLHRWAALAVLTGLTGFPPGRAAAEAGTIISNLANPAVGFNALIGANARPRLPEAYGFAFEEAELSLVSVVDPFWTLAGNLVFTPGGADPEEVFATSTALPGVQVTLGRFRGPFGKHGTLHTHAFPFIEPPLVMAGTIGAEGFRDDGLAASWMTPLPWFCEVTAGAFAAAPAAPDHPLDLGSPAHGNVPVLGHLRNLLEAGEEATLEAGASALTGMGADGLHHSAFGADLTFKDVPLRATNRRALIVQAEYLRRESSGAVDPADPGVRMRRDADGWYGSVQVRWSQNWWTGLRAEDAVHAGNDVLEGMGIGTGRIHKASANLAWTASEFSTLRAEVATARIIPDDGKTPLLDHRVLVQAAFTIGFHPPHAY